MSINLLAYLNSAPALEEIRTALDSFGMAYLHTLPADERWDYPMHVFARDDLRIVYHAGDPLQEEAIIDTMIRRDDACLLATAQFMLTVLVRRYGGSIYKSSL